jgi:hypothetical protein
VERQGDPRFVQRVRTGQGATITWAAETPTGRELSQAWEQQRAALVEKFGRDPGPEDPVFFDPDADEAVPVTDEQVQTGFDELIETAISLGMDPAYVRAWRDVGYLVTQENQHLFSATEVNKFLDAVAHHQDHDDDLDDDVAGLLHERDLGEFVGLVAQGLEMVVSRIVRERDPDHTVEALAHLAAGPQEAGSVGVALAFAVLTGWLAGAREHGIKADTALDWIGRHLDEEAGDAARELGSLVGHATAPEISVEEAGDRLGPVLAPALVWLAAGVVATAGGGDAHWLRQFDPDPDELDDHP